MGSTSVRPSVAIVHDYLTQRGGAERVVLAMMDAFPDAHLYTSLYDPDRTYPDFRLRVVHATVLNRAPLLRRHHRLALPVLAPAFGRTHIDADVVLCSSSGWAHGVQSTGRKVVYCYTPAHWLYQQEDYCIDGGFFERRSLQALGPALRRWDRRAMATADRLLVTSEWIQRRVRAIYGVDAELVAPPVALDPVGRRRPIAGFEPGFLLSVSRLVAHKYVDNVVRAFAGLPEHRLLVVGSGPQEHQLRSLAGGNVSFLSTVDDDQLRWLYANCLGVVTAAREDFGLTPIEAAAVGRPTAALRWGGFLDTVVEGRTGVFFDASGPVLIADAVRRLAGTAWDPTVLQQHAGRFSRQVFIDRLRQVVADTAEAGDTTDAGPPPMACAAMTEGCVP